MWRLGISFHNLSRVRLRFLIVMVYVLIQGEYKLQKAYIAESAKLNGVRGAYPEKSGKNNGNLAKRFRHKTEGIRASLGSRGVV